WVHVQLHQQKGMISLSPPTICNSAVWTSAIFQPQDFGLALVALVALMFWKLPPWLVVLGSGAAGWLLSVAL
ncbi:hypothetical protein OFN52_25255, partial [Escherichia coli]|nr:hypothetical protein [Escherichia coli]